MKIWIHRQHNKNGQWLKYLLPKRLTLRNNPPIYKWLVFGFRFKDRHQYVEIVNEYREDGYTVEYDVRCKDCGEILYHWAYGSITDEYIAYRSKWSEFKNFLRRKFPKKSEDYDVDNSDLPF